VNRFPSAYASARAPAAALAASSEVPSRVAHAIFCNCREESLAIERAGRGRARTTGAIRARARGRRRARTRTTRSARFEFNVYPAVDVY
jgi:hypothetical protein